MEEPRPLRESLRGLLAIILNSSRSVRVETHYTRVLRRVRGASKAMAMSLAVTALRE
jgi:hypothetical protein